MTKVVAIPEGMQGVTPHLVCRDATAAYAFYQQAFGAQAGGILHTPDGQVMHAHLTLAGGPLMLVDEFPDYGSVSPLALNGSAVTMHVYFEDVDSAYARAIDAGCTALMPLEDMFWGDRYCLLQDPYGHKWSLAQHIRDVTPEEMTAYTGPGCHSDEA